MSVPTKIPPRPRRFGRQSAQLTVDALDALVDAGFPPELFPDVHHYSRTSDRRETLRSHRDWAMEKVAEGRKVQGENVATRRRIERLTELLLALPDEEVASLIEQAWLDEPLAEESGQKGHDNEILPADSGIYVAVPLTDEMMPVDISPSRIDVVARVDRSFVKFGKSVNLARRHRDYERTFAPAEVDFVVAARVPLDRLDEVEGAIKTRVAKFRHRAPSGRLLEWLRGISKEDLLKLIRDVLKKPGLVPEPDDSGGGTEPS